MEKKSENKIAPQTPVGVPDFQTLQEALSDPHTVRFIESAIQFYHSAVNSKKKALKRSPYDYLVEHNLLNIEAITTETILIAQKKSERPAKIRLFIEMISHNALSEMMEFYNEASQK